VAYNEGAEYIFKQFHIHKDYDARDYFEKVFLHCFTSIKQTILLSSFWDSKGGHDIAIGELAKPIPIKQAELYPLCLPSGKWSTRERAKGKHTIIIIGAKF
jgi:hypothetical protein